VYFGYTEMWRLAFLPIGFVIVMAASIAFGLVYVVGASKGRAAALRYTSVVAAAFLAASVADLLWAGLSGQLAMFLDRYGWTPLIEMAVLALMCVGSLWFMAVSYANSKRES
jgi:hypothetical protein